MSENAILHHTYQYFLKERVIEYTNDFAHWAGESLEERALAERLSAIYPYAFTGIWELRHELMTVIDQYLETFPEPRQAMAGDEFHFNETVTILFPAGIKANNLAEFHMAIRFLDPSVLYYHFYEGTGPSRRFHERLFGVVREYARQGFARWERSHYRPLYAEHRGDT